MFNYRPKNQVHFVYLLVLLVSLLSACSDDTGCSNVDDQDYSFGGLFLFGGYSAKRGAGPGSISDVADARFTLGGLSYSPAETYQQEISEYIAHGLKIAFRLWPSRPDGSLISPDEVTNATSAQIDAWVNQVSHQVEAVVNDAGLNDHVVAWYIGPEELRYWHANEKELLQRIYEVVHTLDPRDRLAWMYNPQAATAERLMEMGTLLDFLSVGIYPHIANNVHNRFQVRYALEQMKLANVRMGTHKPILPVLEMYESTDLPYSPEDAALVESFVRHDAYCALANGADGILIYSLFERSGFNTYSVYYAAWAQVSRETVELGLRDVIINGVPREALSLDIISGNASVLFEWGSESARVSERFSSLNSRAWEFGCRIYAIIVNSSEERVEFIARDLVREGFTAYRNLLTGELYELESSAVRLSLPPLGVIVLASER